MEIMEYTKPSRISKAIAKASKPTKRKARLTPYDRAKDRKEVSKEVWR